MRLKFGFVLILVLLFVFLPYYCIHGETNKVFAYVKVDEFSRFGVGMSLSFSKFFFGGNFEYLDFGEFTNYATVNDEFYYLLETKKVDRFYGNVEFGYDFGEVIVILELGGKYYDELDEKLVFDCGLEGKFKLFDFMNTFLRVYNNDLVLADWEYKVGFDVNTSEIGYDFVESLSFYVNKKLMYNYLVSNVWASFKLFDISGFAWSLSFLYKFVFGSEVIDPLRLGMSLKIGNFVVGYEMVLPFYSWGNCVSVEYVF